MDIKRRCNADLELFKAWAFSGCLYNQRFPDNYIEAMGLLYINIRWQQKHGKPKYSDDEYDSTVEVQLKFASSTRDDWSHHIKHG